MQVAFTLHANCLSHRTHTFNSLEIQNMDPIEIYKDLKDKIIWIDLKPGSTLNQMELANSFGVSRNPIMIALTRLHVEEWVTYQGSHYVVSPLTLDRMQNITEIRSVLEIHANVWAMNRITTEGLNELKVIEDEIRNLSADASKKEMFQLDYKFHCLLFREAHNRQLANLLRDLLCHYIRFWIASHQRIEKKIFFTEAIGMIKAIETKDEFSLRASTSAHIKASLDRIMQIA
jgi:GntR family transcriptional regulator, rspAB operon transcriptional repressor